MKNIFKFSALIACLAMIGLASCTQEELGTDQYSDGTVAFSAFGPNPVVRGDTLTILGSNLEKVKEVQLPGVDPITEFAEVVAGPKGQLKVVVPVEGPEDAPVTGIVSIVDQNGTVFSSTTELSYTEGIKITSIAPAEVLPGDVVTIKGDYLYNTREVVFVSGNDDGKSYVVGEAIKATRYELKVAVPADAISGAVMLGDVDETNNPDGLLPNTAYTSEITVKDPTVTAFAKTTFKAGAAVEISGTYLNMIKTVKFTGADVDVADFTVAADAKKLTVALPATANDGAVTAVSYAGKEFAAGEIETVRPTEMAVAAETRYKAGLNVIVTGKDLDLVTGAKVSGVDATFSTTAEKTTVVLPATSADGDVVFSLANGNTVTAGSVEVVKPVIESLSAATVVAGKAFDILGKDLDLVSSVSVGEIAADSLDITADKIVVYTSRLSKTGDVVAVAANGDKAVSSIEVTYDESIAITDLPSKIEVKSRLVFKGTGLGQIEAIYIDGVKVVAYTTRTDTEYGFMLPDDITPGIYTMEIVLISGETLTWAVPFEVTGSYKLTTVWEAPNGQIELTWGDPRPTVPVAAFEDLPKGSSMIFCFTQKDQTWGQIQINNGQWQGLVFPEVGSNTFVPTDYYGWEFAYREFEVQLTDDIIATIKANAGDFNGVQTGVIIQGDGMYFNKIVIKSPSEAPETVIWEGSIHQTDYEGSLELGGDDNSSWIDAGLSVGQTIKIYFTADSADWQIQWWGGHWGDMLTPQLNATTNPEAMTDGFVAVEVTEAMHANLTQSQGWGKSVILQGKAITFTKITLL